MKIYFLALGKPKHSFIEDGLAHYLEQISHFIDVEMVEIKDQGSRPEKEFEAIRSALKSRKLGEPGSKVLLLDERGKLKRSVEFAKQIGAWRDQGISRLGLVIGGAYGFNDSVRKEFELFSLSPLTFPHDLARLMVVEQVYRSLHILAGGKYHHEG